jgi:polysaccharide biosynthesis protein PslA
MGNDVAALAGTQFQEHGDAGVPRHSLDELLHGLNGVAKKKRQRRSQVIALVALADVVTIAVIVLTITFAYSPAYVAPRQASLLISILLPAYLLIALNSGAFQIFPENRTVLPIWKAISAFILGSAGVLLYGFLAKVSDDLSRVVTTSSVMLCCLGLLMVRNVMNRWATGYLGQRPYATMCLYDRVPLNESTGFTRIDAEYYGIVPDAADPDMVARLADIAADFDRLVVHCRPEDRIDWAFMIKSLSIPCEIAVPEANVLNPVSINRRSGKICFLINSGPLQWHQRAIKRCFDLAFVLACMPVFLPILVIAAIAIKLDSKGPVFFMQDRIGLNNRPFRVFKFRSMRTDLLDWDGKQSTQRNDPRITRVGGFLRKTSIDELPQLLNVLFGDMSVVGPRPHARLSRAGDRLFWEVDTSYWHRHVVKPGITGLAQVRGQRGNTFHEDQLRSRLTSDLEYVAEWSLFTDIIIVLRTVGVVTHNNAF